MGLFTRKARPAAGSQVKAAMPVQKSGARKPPESRSGQPSHPGSDQLSDSEFEAFRDGVLEWTEWKEELVVSKQLHVIEELRPVVELTDHQECIRETVTKTGVEVERVGKRNEVSER